MLRINPDSELDLMYSSMKIRSNWKAFTIFEHLPTLRAMAGGCTTIIELGVADPISTWAFLKGLKDTSMPGSRLISCDIIRDENVDNVCRVAEDEGLEFSFRLGNDLKLEFPEADLIFIDTWHVYGHLKRELAKFAPLAKKWIVLHDTTTDAVEGESIRMKMDIDKQIAESGYPREEIEKGLWPAVEEFLEENPNWRIEARYMNCNGLTILERFKD